MKKRILSVLLAFAMIFTLIPTAFAATYQVVTVDKTTVQQGETVNVKVTLPNISETAGSFTVNLKFDTTLFEVVERAAPPKISATDEDYGTPDDVKIVANNAAGANPVGELTANAAYTFNTMEVAGVTVIDATLKAKASGTAAFSFTTFEITKSEGSTVWIVKDTDLEAPPSVTISGGVTPPQHTHDLKKVDAKAATCTEAGNKEYWECKTCGNFYWDADGKDVITNKNDVIVEAGHKYGDLIAEVSATCGENGVKAHYECSVCHKNFDTNFDELTDLVIPATGEHKWELVVGGYTDGATQHTVKCSVCGQKKDEAHADRPGDKSDKWESDKDNHWNVYGCGTIMNKAAHTWDAGVETTPATCTKAGVKTFTCTKCGYQKTEPIPVIAHKYEWKHDETNHWQECSVCHDIIDKAEHTYAPHKCEETATCTKAGCGYVKSAGQHSWNDGEVTTPATCTTDGVKTYTCKVCSETKTEPIKASGHSLTKVEAVAATCTEPGNNEYWTCSVCKKVFKADKTTETTVAAETLAALGHTLTETPAVTPTCAAGGNNGYWTCSVCHKVFKADKTTETTVAAEKLAKDPANHTGGEELRGAVAASCMTAGRKADTYCKGCGKLTKAGDLIPPTGVHNYKDGVCTTCGSKQPADNATIKATIEKVVADVKEAVEEVLDKAIKNETDANTKKILEKLKGYVSGSSRSKLQAVYNVTMNRNNADLKDGETLADGQNVTIAISEETYNALKSGAKIVESYLDKDGNAQTREINATLKQVGGGYTVTFASDKTAVYGLMTRTSSGGSSGSGSSYTSGQSFTTDLPADSINRVTVNGKKLDSKYYTVSSNGSGSIVTLTDAYLATLKAGKYTVKIENKTHVSTGTFTIKADGTLSSPKTADAGIALYAMLAVSSLMGTAVVSKKRRKA